MHNHLNAGKIVYDKMTMKSKRLFIQWTTQMKADVYKRKDARAPLVKSYGFMFVKLTHSPARKP